MHLSKKKEIKKIIIQSNSLIKDVINNLNNSRLKIALVVDKNNKLIGTVVDGDIRRGLLNGIVIDDEVTKIVHRNPIIVNPKIKKNEILILMKKNELQHIPIVDELKNPVGLYLLDEISHKIDRENNFIIMAGGLGKRMLPETKIIPKAMIKVSGVPMIEHVVLQAKKCGFFNFTFSINYLGNKIKEYFSSGKKLNVSVKYIEEKSFLGTAGSLCYLKNLNDQPIVVTNCDVLSSMDYGDALDYHKANSADATMVVHNYKTHNSFGVIKTNGKKFISCEEKPIRYENINAGIYILNSKVLKHIEHEKKLEMPDFFKKLKKKGKKVIVYPIYEFWNDLGQKKN